MQSAPVAIYVSGISTPKVHPEFPPRPGTLTLIAEDYTVAQIAETLSIGYGTVQTHLRNIRIKLESRGR
jgi:DNA-binding NarL/FixJ family response regulator